MRNKAVPIVLISLISLIALWFAFSLYSIFTGVTRTTSSLVTQPVALTQPTETPQPASDKQPVLATEVVPVQSAPTTNQIAAPVAPAPVYVYSEVIRGAGIAASDDGYVTDMVLGPDGWRTTGANLWQRANNGNVGMSMPLIWNLERVNQYVIATYGSWSAAHDAWVSTGDF